MNFLNITFSEHYNYVNDAFIEFNSDFINLLFLTDILIIRKFFYHKKARSLVLSTVFLLSHPRYRQKNLEHEIKT